MKALFQHSLVMIRVGTSLAVCSGLLLSSSCTHFVDTSPAELRASLNTKKSKSSGDLVDIVHSHTKSHRFVVTHVDDEQIRGVDIKGNQVQFPLASIDSLTVRKVNYPATALTVIVGAPLTILLAWAAISDDDSDETF